MEKCTAHITDCDMKDDDSSSCHVRARGDEAQAPLLLNPFNFDEILYWREDRGRFGEATSISLPI